MNTETTTTKLVLIQNELKAPKNQYNGFGKYNYRSCEDILEALKPLLLKYECQLFIKDEVKSVGEIAYVEATATFFDGITGYVATAQAGIDIHRKGMDIAQCFGSSSSYARKYALNGLFLIDDTKDADATNEHDKEKPAFKEVQPMKPIDEKPWLNKGEPLMKAKDYLRNGGSISDIEKKYKLSKEIRAILEAEVKPTQSVKATGLNGDAGNMFNEQYNDETPF